MMKNFRKSVLAVCVLAMAFCFSTGAVFAGTEEIFEVIDAFTEKFQNERDSWEMVMAEEFKNSAYETFEKYTLQKKDGSVALFLEMQGESDGEKWEKSFLCGYTSVNFGGVAGDLRPGMSPDEAKILFGGDGAGEADMLNWEDDETGDTRVTLSFENGGAVLLQFSSVAGGGGEDEAAIERLYRKYDDLKKTLSAK
jgi:hypothetical protein